MAITAVTQRGDFGSSTEASEHTGTLTAQPGDNPCVVHLTLSQGSSTDPVFPSTVSVAGVSVSKVTELIYKNTGTERIGIAVYAGYGAWSGTAFTTGALGFTTSGWRCDVFEIIGGAQSSIVPTGQFEENSDLIDDSEALSVSLPSAPTATSRCLICVGRNTATANEISVDGDWTELDEDDHSTPSTLLLSAWRSDAADQTTAVTGGAGIGNLVTGIIIYEIAEASGATVVERSASFDATVAISSVPQRELLRSAAIGATVGISSVPQRELIRSASIGVGVGVSSVPQRELIRSALFDALVSISSSGAVLGVHERSVSFNIAVNISTSPQRELIRSASFDTVVSILTSGLVPRIASNFFDIPDSQTCMNPTHNHGTVSARPFTRGTTAGREIRRGI